MAKKRRRQPLHVYRCEVSPPQLGLIRAGSCVYQGDTGLVYRIHDVREIPGSTHRIIRARIVGDAFSVSQREIGSIPVVLLTPMGSA